MEPKPLGSIAPIDISNCIDVYLKFVTGARFNQAFQRDYLIGTHLIDAPDLDFNSV
jgi:hypothetical protein